MKMIQSKGARPLAARGVLAGTLCSFVLALSASFAGADGTMAGGDTGSLPISVPTDPLDRSLVDQAFYMSGHPDVLMRSLRGVSGTGTVRRWELSETRAYLEFFGDVRIHLDENVLRQTSIDMGVTPGISGEGMLAVLEFDGRVTRPTSVPNVSSLPLPYVRMSNARVFDSPVILHTMQATGERGRLAFTSSRGVLTIDQHVDPRL